MNTLLSLGFSLLSAVFPQTPETKTNLAQTYQCKDLQWVQPATLGTDGHLRGQAQVECDFVGASGGGFPELETYLTDTLKKQATHVYSGPVAGNYEGLPANQYDIDLGLKFSGSPVTARQKETIATDEHTRLVTLMKTSGITGSSYDQYIKGFDILLNVVPVPANNNYHGTLSVSIDMTKPWYAPSGVFQSEVVKAVEGAVTNYRDTLINELQNHL